MFFSKLLLVALFFISSVLGADTCDLDDSEKRICLTAEGNSLDTSEDCENEGCCWDQTSSSSSSSSCDTSGGYYEEIGDQFDCDLEDGCWDGTVCWYEFITPSCYYGYDYENSYCENGTDWSVDYVGKSGQFKIYPCANDKCWIKVNILAWQKYDGNGDKGEAISSFSLASAEAASQHDGDSSVYSSSANGTTIGAVKLQYLWDTKDGEATMNFITWLLDKDEDVYVTNSDGSTSHYILRQHTFKFSIEAEFPISDSDGENQTLVFSIRLNSGGGCSSDDDETEETDSDNSSKFEWGSSFFIESPTTAEIDGNSRDVEVEHDYNSNGKHVDIYYTFSGFDVTDDKDTSTIYYDPWILGSFDSSSNIVKFNFFITFIFSFVVCSFLY
jgi:hypothetical protein